MNLRDCAPFASLHAPDLTPEQVGVWELAYAAGQKLEAAGKSDEAVARYEEAARIDDQFADLQFRWGGATPHWGELGRPCQDSLARDLDAVRFRSDTAVNQTIRRVAEDRASDGVLLVDAERDFAAASPGGIPGENCSSNTST